MHFPSNFFKQNQMVGRFKMHIAANTLFESNDASGYTLDWTLFWFFYANRVKTLQIDRIDKKFIYW